MERWSAVFAAPIQWDIHTESVKKSRNLSGGSSAGHYRNLRCVKCFLCSALWQLAAAIRKEISRHYQRASQWPAVAVRVGQFMQHSTSAFSRKSLKVLLDSAPISIFHFFFFLMFFANTFLTWCWWTKPHADTWEESQTDLPPHRALPEINPNALFHFANQFRIGRAGLGERERYRLAVVITINHLWNAAMSHARLCH